MLLGISRVIPIGLFALVILLYVKLIYINWQMWPAAAWVIVLAAHWIIFYLAVLVTNTQPSHDTNVWINGLTIHTSGTFIYAARVMRRVFIRDAK